MDLDPTPVRTVQRNLSLYDMGNECTNFSPATKSPIMPHNPCSNSYLRPLYSVTTHASHSDAPDQSMISDFPLTMLRTSCWRALSLLSLGLFDTTQQQCRFSAQDTIFFPTFAHSYPHLTLLFSLPGGRHGPIPSRHLALCLSPWPSLFSRNQRERREGCSPALLPGANCSTGRRKNE